MNTPDNRRPFPVTDSYWDAPDDGVPLDLTSLGHPGWWERHGDLWEPVAPQ